MSNTAEQTAQEEHEKDLQEHAKIYYNTASAVGALLSDILVGNAHIGPASGSPHFRAILGSSIIGAAISEAAQHDKAHAKAIFDELATGLVQLGERLELNGQGAANDDSSS